MTDLLASPRAFAAIRGVTYDPTDLASVLALEAASETIRTYCNRRFSYVEDDEFSIRIRDYRTSIALPELPVHGVSLITEDGEELDDDDWYVATGTGTVHRNVGYWDRSEPVVITYTHGYVLPTEPEPTLPADIQLVCLQLAGRRTTTDSRAPESETIGQYAVTYAGEDASGGLTSEERSTLDLYRLRTMP